MFGLCIIQVDVCLQYGARGVRLVLVARRKAELDGVASRARSLGAAGVLAMTADMSVGSDMDRVLNATMEAYGR